MARAGVLAAPLLVALLVLASGPGFAGAGDRAGGGASPGADDAGVVREATVVGPAIELPETEKAAYLAEADALAAEHGLAPRTNVFVVVKPETMWLVFVNGTVAEGMVTATGTAVPPDEAGRGGMGVLFADSVDVRTRGAETALSDLATEPDRHAYDLVRVTAPYRQLGFALDLGTDRTNRYTYGVLSATPGRTLSLQPPGRAARWGVLNISSNAYGLVIENEFERRLPGGLVTAATVAFDDVHFWTNATVSVDAVVVPSSLYGNTPHAGDERVVLYVVDTTVRARPVGSVDAIAERGERYAGEVVTVTARAAGSRTSAKRHLVETAGCGLGSVANPVTGCLPATTDATLHAGVLYDGQPEGRAETVPYAGVSNAGLDGATATGNGTYEVTGRVVRTAELDPSLPPGYGLVVYGMERTGPAGVDDRTARRVGAWRDRVATRLRGQLGTAERDWGATWRELADREPTHGISVRNVQ